MKRLMVLAALLVLIPAVIACSDDDDDGASTGATGSGASSPTVEPTTDSGSGATGTADATATTEPTESPEPVTVQIGALLPLTGGLASVGANSLAALELARDNLNADSNVQIELVVKDTGLDPDTALAKLQEFDAEGINIIVGPYASSEVTNVKSYADANGMMLVSPLSTAGTLSVPDNIFRFIPDDRAEGEAVVNALIDEGITTVIPVTRDDAGNQGLQTAVKRFFEEAEYTIADGVTYGPGETDFDSVVEDIIIAIDAAGSAPEETAIYLTAFDEVIDLFTAATTLGDTRLTGSVWYGSDSIAQSPTVIADDIAAAFAASVGYPNPILGLRDEDEALWGPVKADLAETLGHETDAFSLAAYDSLVVLHQAFEAVGADAELDTFIDAFVDAAANHVGLTGPTVLNDAGDRASASFDFWAICEASNGFTWKRTISYAVYENDSVEISREDC